MVVIYLGITVKPLLPPLLRGAPTRRLAAYLGCTLVEFTLALIGHPMK